MAKNYYEILGVDKNSSIDEIKKNFRTLSLKWHPDRHANESEDKKKEAEEKFKEIAEAYAVLSDPDKKRKYDTYGTVDDVPDFSGGFSGFSGFPGFNFGGMGDIDADDIFNILSTFDISALALTDKLFPPEILFPIYCIKIFSL